VEHEPVQGKPAVEPVLALVAKAFMETEDFLSHETSLIPGGTDVMCSLQSVRKLEIEADY
jgi:hypothetical protein